MCVCVCEKPKTCHDGDSVQVGGCVVGVWGGGILWSANVGGIMMETVQVGGCGRSVCGGGILWSNC